MVQFSTSGQGRRFQCCIGDGGIGIRNSLKRNPKLRHVDSEWTAIELAVKELVSGTAFPTRGIGLFSAFEEMYAPGRELMIHSGNGILTVNQESEIRLTRANQFQGTLVHLSIPA